MKRLTKQAASRRLRKLASVAKLVKYNRAISTLVKKAEEVFVPPYLRRSDLPETATGDEILYNRMRPDSVNRLDRGDGGSTYMTPSADASFNYPGSGTRSLDVIPNNYDLPVGLMPALAANTETWKDPEGHIHSSLWGAGLPKDYKRPYGPLMSGRMAEARADLVIDAVRRADPNYTGPKPSFGQFDPNMWNVMNARKLYTPRATRDFEVQEFLKSNPSIQLDNGPEAPKAPAKPKGRNLLKKRSASKKRAGGPANPYGAPARVASGAQNARAIGGANGVSVGARLIGGAIGGLPAYYLLGPKATNGAGAPAKQPAPAQQRAGGAPAATIPAPATQTQQRTYPFGINPQYLHNVMPGVGGKR